MLCISDQWSGGVAARRLFWLVTQPRSSASKVQILAATIPQLPLILISSASFTSRFACMHYRGIPKYLSFYLSPSNEQSENQPDPCAQKIATFNFEFPKMLGSQSLKLWCVF
uniref:Uncharacterized protein n=1 Tax=Kalanchoe fedtschenkoi TaxID=63787 RepID=A0A7N0SVB0_KALFE